LPARFQTMAFVKSHTTDSQRSSVTERFAADKRLLALDALSELTRQFAVNNDFHHLLNTWLMTLSGQFSVANCFAVVKNPTSRSLSPVIFVRGKMVGNEQLESLIINSSIEKILFGLDSPVQVKDLTMTKTTSDLVKNLVEINISVLAPMVYGGTCFGYLGLGEKVTRKPFESADISLLATLMDTINPLIANSYHFEEVSYIKGWYIDVLNSVRQGVFVFGKDNILLSLNSAGHRILAGFNPNIVEPGVYCGMSVEQVFPNDVYSGWAKRLIRFRTEKCENVVESLIAKSYDVNRIYNIRINAVNCVGKTNSDIVLTIDDVTEEKENEQRIFDLERLADKGAMASSISHELNNFVALILGGVELCQYSVRKGKIEDVSNILEKLKRNAGNAERITASLTNFGRLEMRKQIADLNTVVTDVLSFVVAQKRFDHIHIQTELDHNIQKVNIDPDQILQLLLNLLNNAADAITEANRTSGQIVVKTIQGSKSITLSVSDNGVGIPDNVKKFLFKSHLTTKRTGHGYGLVTCAQIMKSHQIEVDFQSEVGDGTSMILSFPLN